MHSRLPRGVRPRLEGKPRTPLSSRVAPGISWTQLSGLKGVNTPGKFGERTRTCSPGQAGKEGPQLSRTGASQGFPRAATPMGVFSRGTTRISGSLSCGARASGPCSSAVGTLLVLHIAQEVFQLVILLFPPCLPALMQTKQWTPSHPSLSSVLPPTL